MRHKIKGIVLREAPKGETSKLLTVLASDLGVITVNAKGVRKLSSAYLKSAQQFAFSDMLLYEKNGFYTLTEAALIAEFYPVREDIKSYALACYLCEAASAFAVPGEEANNVIHSFGHQIGVRASLVCRMRLYARNRILRYLRRRDIE